MTLKIKSITISLSANATDTGNIDIAAGKRFTIHKILNNSTGNFTINQIKNSGTGENYLSGTIDNTMIKEGGGSSFTLPVPLTLEGATKLEVEVTDTSGTSNTVRIAFVGDEQ